MKWWALHLSSSGNNSALRAALHELPGITVHALPPPVATQRVEESVTREMPGHGSAVTLLHNRHLQVLRHHCLLAVLLLRVQVVETRSITTKRCSCSASFRARRSSEGSSPFSSNSMTSRTRGSFRCSSAKDTGSTITGADRRNSAMFAAPPLVVSLSTAATCTSASAIPSREAGACGQRDKASALVFTLPGQYWIVTSFTPLLYTLVHHRACFPLGFGVSSTALTAV